MNSKERLIRTMQFKPVDRVPIVEWPIRPATMREWIKQGYPQGVSTKDFFGQDAFFIDAPVNLSMLPPFEEKIIKEDANYKIWQDNLGATRKDFKSTENPGFVTRSWLKFAVENREDFLAIKKRYISCLPGRYPHNWDEMSNILKKSTVPIHLSIPFLFWVARDWMGFENLCISFYDEPKLVEEMFEFIADFTIEAIKRCVAETKVDIVELKEDMAYKHAPMISPDMFRKFMSKHYIRIVDFFKRHAVNIVYVDCDGYPGGLIDEWIETGIDAMSPCEIAAGNDMIALRNKYSTFGFFGGIDKRELAKTEKDIYNEVISKVPFLLEKGGYIPHVDHAVPFDVPLKNYIYYTDLLTKIIKGLN